MVVVVFGVFVDACCCCGCGCCCCCGWGSSASVSSGGPAWLLLVLLMLRDWLGRVVAGSPCHLGQREIRRD